MTFVRGGFKYAELNDLNAQAIEIRFDDTEFSLLIILPNTMEDLLELEETMKNYDLTGIVDRMRMERMFVTIPIFQIKYQISLKNISKQVSVISCKKKYH